MKFRNIIFLTLLFCSCEYIGAGSLGAYKILVFPVDKQQLNIALDSLYMKYPKYSVSKKWEYESKYWARDGYDSLPRLTFYFAENYEEMYYVTFLDPGFQAKNPNYVRLGIRAVYHQNIGWKEIKKYNDEEKVRIQRRFEEEIISKLEKLTNTKAFDEKTSP